jgi:hypothetical protein
MEFFGLLYIKYNVVYYREKRVKKKYFLPNIYSSRECGGYRHSRRSDGCVYSSGVTLPVTGGTPNTHKRKKKYFKNKSK